MKARINESEEYLKQLQAQMPHISGIESVLSTLRGCRVALKEMRSALQHTRTGAVTRCNRAEKMVAELLED